MVLLITDEVFSFAPQNIADYTYLLFGLETMGLEMRVLLVFAMAICLPSAAYAAEGTATFYTPPYVRKYIILPFRIYYITS